MALLTYGAGAAHAAKTSLDIPPQSLALALNTVGVETGTEVLYSKDLVSGRRAPALNGLYEPRDALVALLNGTDLRVQKTGDNVYVISPLAKPERPLQLAAATPKPATSSTIETVVVTAQNASAKTSRRCRSR